jgi:hypothetical protein
MLADERRIASSLIVVASSKASPERTGASMNFRNSRDLFHR